MNCLKFLLIDDDLLFAEIVTELVQLAFPGSMVRPVSDVADFNAAIHSQAFDCVITDYKMPLINGIALSHDVRNEFPYLPIVLITGAGDEEIATQALLGGVTDYLPKAKTNVGSLRRTLERAIKLCQQRRVIDDQRRELEMFAHALAHDFKQPLRQITTFAKSVSAELDQHGSTQVRKQLSFMRSAANRLTALVEVLSEYTLLGRSPKLEKVYAKKVVADAVSALTGYISERKGIVSNRADVSFYGNSTMMIYVLQNIISNGLKFNRSLTPTVEIDSISDGSQCEISVSDNGIGIEEGQRDAIFSPLMRLHAQDEFTGTGLGLTLARWALASQHGSIRCCANSGEGSRFVITIPCGQKEGTR